MSIHAQARWLRRWGHFDFLSVHVSVMVGVILCGALALDLPGMFEASPLNLGLCIPVGIAFGWAATRIDHMVARRVWRRDRQTRKPAKEAGRRSLIKRARYRLATKVRPAGSTKSESFGIAEETLPPSLSKDPSERIVWLKRLTLLCLAAAFEEMIFRGFLVQASFLLPHTALISAALVGSVVIFGLAHVWFGWMHVFAKLPLGVLALITVLTLETVLAAVIMHITFNAKIWQETDGDIGHLFQT